jgi:hypothetical protein
MNPITIENLQIRVACAHYSPPSPHLPANQLVAVASLKPRNFQFIEKIDRVIQALQAENLLALFLGEMIAMLFYEMPSYLLCPCPLDAADEALG